METINNNLNGFNYQKSLKDRNTHIVNKFITVEKYINRPIASLIVRTVYNTRVTPNGLTYLNFILGLLAAFLFSRGEYIYFVFGGIFIQLSSIVDSADGMLARAKNMCSAYGASLDIFLDRITDFILVVGITIGLYTATADISLLITGLLTAGLLNLQVSLFYIANNYSQKKETGLTGEARAFMLLSILVFSVVDRLDIFIYILGAQTVINILWRVVHFIYLGKKSKCTRA
jgi:phosphatidylglycerophosphate synthase